MSDTLGEVPSPPDQVDPPGETESSDKKSGFIVDPFKKVLTLIFVLISVGVIALLVSYFTGLPIPLLVPVAVGIAAAIVALAREELRSVTISCTWPIVAGAVAAMLATNVITAVVATRAAESQDPVAAAEFVQPETGADPAQTSCIDDVKIAASDNSHPEFIFELLFSPRCQAGWARVTRKDGAALGNQISMSIYRRADPTGSTRQDALEPDVTSGYTTLLVRNEGTDKLCADGSITTGAATISAATLCV